MVFCREVTLLQEFLQIAGKNVNVKTKGIPCHFPFWKFGVTWVWEIAFEFLFQKSKVGLDLFLNSPPRPSRPLSGVVQAMHFFFERDDAQRQLRHKNLDIIIVIDPVNVIALQGQIWIIKPLENIHEVGQL